MARAPFDSGTSRPPVTFAASALKAVNPYIFDHLPDDSVIQIGTINTADNYFEWAEVDGDAGRAPLEGAVLPGIWPPQWTAPISPSVPRPSSTAVIPPVAPPPRKFPWLPVGIGLAVATAVGVGLWQLNKRSR